MDSLEDIPGRTVSLGPGKSVSYGSSVIPDFVRIIENFSKRNFKEFRQRNAPAAAAIGCVPWFSSRAVAEALSLIDQVCIATDKHVAINDAQRWFLGNAKGLSAEYLPELRHLVKRSRSGAVPVATPENIPGAPLLGPLRFVGWANRKNGNVINPLLHTKMLVLGVTQYMEDDNEWAGPIMTFTPLVTWMGSANWTLTALKHQEFGYWSDEKALVEANNRYLVDVLGRSETDRWSSPTPNPDLVDKEWDDEAFAEYAADSDD